MAFLEDSCEFCGGRPLKEFTATAQRYQHFAFPVAGDAECHIRDEVTGGRDGVTPEGLKPF